jgi:hypothetical protein
MDRSNSTFQRAREFVEIDGAAERAERRGPRMRTFACNSDRMAPSAKLGDQRPTLINRIILRLNWIASSQ